MNQKQWFVLSGIFLLSILYIIFIDFHFNNCIEDSFGNFADTYKSSLEVESSSPFYEDFAYNEYNLIGCAIQIEIDYIFVKLAIFFTIICFVMGILESKKK